MHSDLEKLVKGGKVPANFAKRLDKISPGKYVIHGEWGVGKVEAWSLPKQVVKVNFEKRPGYVMGLKLAFNQLVPVPEGHFLIDCYDDPEGMRNLAEDKESILPFIKDVLERNLSLREGVNEVLPMQPEDMERFLSGRVIPTDQWKTWWEKARSAMRQSPQFRLPTKKGEAITLRQAASAAEALLADYTEAGSLEACVRILDQAHPTEVLRGEKELAVRLVAAMEKDIRRDHVEPQHVLELIIIRDEIIGKVLNSEEARAAVDAAVADGNEQKLTSLEDKLSSVPADELVKYIGELTPPRQQCVYAAVLSAYADVLAGISQQSLQPSVLIWICKERQGVSKEIVEKAKMALGAAIISAIERDSAEGTPNRALRLRNMLVEDKELAPDLVSGLTETEARQSMILPYCRTWIAISSWQT